MGIINSTSVITAVRLQEQGGDPAAPDAGYQLLFVKAGGVYAINSASAVVGPLTGDHGGLTGLADDDHTQYHTDARGDARYPQLAHTHAGTTNGIKLAQANTHETPDTDSATSSLHHTIGVTATTAAAGNHTHAGGTLEVKEADGAPDVNSVTLITVTNGKLTDNGGGSISLDLGGGGSGHTIQDEGSDMTARTNLNFVGAGVTVTDDAGNDATVVTIPGGSLGSGQTLLTFHPYQNEPPAANYATLDTRNGHPVLDFDAAADESAIFTGILPRSYAGGGVTVYLHLTDTNDTNAAHKSYWDVSFERDTAQDLDADSFAAAQSGNISPNGTSGIPVVLSIAFTNGAQMDSVAAGELFRLMVTRDANNGSDDWANDAELLLVELKET